MVRVEHSDQPDAARHAAYQRKYERFTLRLARWRRCGNHHRRHARLSRFDRIDLNLSTDPTMKHVGDLLAKMLLDYEVDFVFGMPGGQTTALHQGIARLAPEIEHILVRDERSARMRPMPTRA